MCSAILDQMKLHWCWWLVICAGKFLIQDFTPKIFLSVLSGKNTAVRDPHALLLSQVKVKFCQSRISSSLVWLHDCQYYTCGFVFTSATLPSRRAWRWRYEDNMLKRIAKKTGVTECHYLS